MNPFHHPDQERCKKLTEIGFPYTSLFHYSDGFICHDDYVEDLKNGDIVRHPLPENIAVCPSVMELLDVIPSYLDEKHLKIQKWKKDYAVCYIENNHDDYEGYHYADTLPNALCDLVFWLVENKYLKF